MGSAGADRHQAKLGRAILAGGLIGDVTLERVLDDAADRGKLKTISRIAGSRHISLVLALSRSRI